MATQHNNSRSEAGDAVAAKPALIAEVHPALYRDSELYDGELKDEEVRIREVYAKRKHAIPAERYSSSNPGNLYIRRELEGHLLSGLSRFHCQPLSSKKILDVGCGSGRWLQKFLEWGATAENLYGIDLIEDRVIKARQDLPEGVTVDVGSASKLSFPDQTFDLLSQFVMFSSILHAPTRREIAREMIRVLKPGGDIVWYDFFRNNPWNPDVRGVGKKEIVDLFPGCRVTVQRMTVAPPLTRHMGVLVPLLYPALASLKFCSTHYLVFVRK